MTIEFENNGITAKYTSVEVPFPQCSNCDAFESDDCELLSRHCENCIWIKENE